MIQKLHHGAVEMEKIQHRCVHQPTHVNKAKFLFAAPLLLEVAKSFMLIILQQIHTVSSVGLYNQPSNHVELWIKWRISNIDKEN